MLTTFACKIHGAMRLIYMLYGHVKLLKKLWRVIGCAVLNSTRKTSKHVLHYELMVPKKCLCQAVRKSTVDIILSCLISLSIDIILCYLVKLETMTLSFV